MARSAATAPTAPDPRLRGRTYAIPFEDVWQGALRVVRSRLRGWSLEDADDQEGLVVAHVAARWQRLAGTVEIRIVLDADAQTRVDAVATTAAATRDFGSNARRLRRFFRALDREAVRERDRRLTAGTPPR